MDSILYLLFAFSALIYFVPKSRTKYLVGLLLFWLYSIPVLYKSPLRIPMLDFDLNSGRMLFLGITIIFFLSLFSRNIKQKLRRFETWIILLLLSVFIAETLNLSSIGIPRYISDITYVLTYVFLYFSVRWNLKSQVDISILKKAILVFAIASSITSLIQFVVDPSFLRVGAARNAFGEYIRANGFFPNEFDQSLFLIIALVLNWSIMRQKKFPTLIVLLFGISIFFTMHRVSWAIFIVVVFVMLYFAVTISRKNSWIVVPILVLVATIMLLTITVPWERLISQIPFFNAFIDERVSIDTWTIRMQYNALALEIAQKFPFGFGVYGPRYYQFALANGLPLNRNFETMELVPYIVHNTFLASAVKYGWLGFVSLSAFLIEAIIYYVRIYRLFSKGWAAPIIIVMSYIFFGMTQDLSFAVELQSLLLFSIALGIYTCEERKMLSDLRFHQKTY